MSDIKGFSVITHREHGWYFGKFMSGVFSDNCEWLRMPKELRTGWGFKLDVFFCHTARPIPRLGLLTQKELTIGQVLDRGDAHAARFFGGQLFAKIKQKPNPDRKFSGWSPWKGRYWFVLRLPKWLPIVFFSFSTPWKSGYVGFKTYGCEPYFKSSKTEDGGDVTWCGKSEQQLAAGRAEIRIACPSITLRTDRS